MRKTLRNYALIAVMLLASVVTFAQSKITGTVVDAETGEGLPGASVVLKGTTDGTITDFNGDFSLTVDANSATVVISFVGFKTIEKSINLSETQSLGNIQLLPGADELSPVEVLASVAVDRKTPVAVSKIDALDIEEKASNQEFPELLKSTPGVYTTKQGGGYGDSRINVRGFNDENVAVLINGVPVNDMENGNVYWSNWAGLTDVTQSMQVQRGLGASKVAVPSIGGTINILTKTTDAVEGGSVMYGFGNNGYQKLGMTVSTGLMDNGWAVAVSGSKTTGNGYIDGTQFEGYNYFFNITKQINDSHILSLTGFGAPQVHGQRPNASTIATYRNAPSGIKYNGTYGYRDGQLVMYEDNFYHKPQFSLNHYWTINNKSELSTAVYLSTGTGGGGGTWGNWDPADRGTYQPKDIDALVDANLNTDDGNALALMRASRNDHKWYGVLSTYTNEISDNFSLLAGADLRYYVASHFYEVTDLLGADYYLDNSDINNPNRLLKKGDKFNYNNDGVVNWAGGFLQGEYSSGALSAFVTLSASNTGYKRIDYFSYLDSDPLQESEVSNHLGYQIKGGANYNLTRNHNVFANIGYFEKAPGFDGVFLNNDQFINEAAENQKILSYELGYGYRSASFNANVNLYRTAWMDRTLTDAFQGDDDPSTPNVDESEEFYYASLLGVDALHQGIEIDFVWNPVRVFSLEGMISLGDWTWTNDVDGQTIFNEANEEVGSFDKLYIGGLKVGDVAQHTYALGGTYEPFQGLKLSANANFFDKLYADYDPNTRTDAPENGSVEQPLEYPSYWTLDVFARYNFQLGNLDATLLGNVNNILDTEYIAEGNDGTLATTSVYYGFGRTYTATLKVRF